MDESSPEIKPSSPENKSPGDLSEKEKQALKAALQSIGSKNV